MDNRAKFERRGKLDAGKAKSASFARSTPPLFVSVLRGYHAPLKLGEQLAADWTLLDRNRARHALLDQDIGEGQSARSKKCRD